ncbi:slipin family protein [Rhodotorula paludigena]|uniref:slipin family protein n=1 Tax=Rhodotorula paludigena TaxID=86838 RepID=UPI00317AC42A
MSTSGYHAPEPVKGAPLGGDEATTIGSNGPRHNNPQQGIIQVQPLRKDDMQPSYAQTMPADNLEYGCYGSMINCLGSCCGTLGSIPCCFCFPNPYKSVGQGSVGLIERFGQFVKSVDPGLVKVNPFSEKLSIVDVKIQVIELPAQQVLSKDNLQCSISSVIVWTVTNPYRSKFAIADVRKALVERAQTTLRDVAGSRNLQSLLTEREAVAAEIEQIVESVSERWGVKVESILIKDIEIPPDIQNSLSSAAQQRRLGEAKVIQAQAEVDSARLMREAADILSSPAAIQIRQLEALQSMARNSGSKVIFVPMNLMGGSTSGSDSGLINNTAMVQALNNTGY